MILIQQEQISTTHKMNPNQFFIQEAMFLLEKRQFIENLKPDLGSETFGGIRFILFLLWQQKMLAYFPPCMLFSVGQ